jgi:hypothetical protein
MALVPNPGRVLLTSSSMQVVYVAFIFDVGTKVLEYLQNNRELKWQDAIVPILLIIVPPLRIVLQQSLASAAERKAAEEKVVRQKLEEVATSAGPPITPADVAQIKREAAAAVNPKPLKE